MTAAQPDEVVVRPPPVRSVLVALMIVFPGKIWAQSATSTASSVSDGARRSMETIAIIGGRSGADRAPGSAHVIDEGELERFEYDDVQRVLTRVPGVYVRDEDGFGLRPNIGIRGANANRSAKIVLLEDGILLGPAPYAAPAAYFIPLSTRMVGLEVFKGPAAVRTGPYTVGGAVNFLTADIPDGHGGLVDLAAGQFGYYKGHLRYGWGGEHFGFLVEGLRLASSGFKSLDGGGNTGFEKNEVMAKLRLSTDRSDDFYHRLEVKLGWADEGSSSTYLGLAQSDFDAAPYRRYGASRLGRMTWERIQVELSYGLWAGQGFQARLTAYRHDFSRPWLRFNGFGDRFDPQQVLASEDPVRLGILRGERSSSEAGPVDTERGPGLLRMVNNDRRYVSQGVQLDGDWNLVHGAGFGQRIRFGARLHYDRVSREHVEQTYEMVVLGGFQGDLIRTAFPPETTRFDRDQALAVSGYIHDEIRLFDKLLVSPGARIEHIRTERNERTAANDPESPRVSTERTQTVVVPGVGIYYPLHRCLGALAGVHRGFSPVGPGNPETVEPEASVSYEGGLRFKLGRTEAEVIGFFSDYTNLLLECSESQTCESSQVGQQFNGGAVWIYGLEALAHQLITLPARAVVGLDARYTLTLSEFRDDIRSRNPQFERVQPGDRLPYVPEHQANLSARISIPFGSVLTSLSLSYTFVDRMRDFASQGDIGDIRLGRALTEKDFTDIQHILDLALQADVDDRNRIYIKIDNLLDQVYVASRRPLGARPGRPLTAQIGYTHRFRGS